MEKQAQGAVEARDPRRRMAPMKMSTRPFNPEDPGRSDPSASPDPRPHLHVTCFSGWPDVRPYWEELNRTYKAGELALDLRAHEIIWDRFLGPRGYELQIHVVLEGDRCVGIFPMSRSHVDPFGTPFWSLSDDFVIAREYFCPEERIHEAIELLPPHFSDDMSCFYRPADTGRFQEGLGGVIDLKGSREVYLASLRGSARRDLLQTFRRNADLRIEVDSRVEAGEIAPLLEKYLRYRMRRCGDSRPGYYEYSRDKILCDLALMERAEEMSRLVALYLRLDDELVAANFSVRREADRVDDYLCIRTDDAVHAKRGLGIFAILANMDLCRSMGVRFYDMSASGAAYKTKFANSVRTYYHRRWELEALQGEASSGQ
jgi:hypothetical protein